MSEVQGDDPPFPIALSDVCECLPLPRMLWHHPDMEWVDVGDISGDPEVNGERYNAGPYDAWIIGCPDCRLVYAHGETDL